MATSGKDKIRVGDVESPFSEAITVARKPIFASTSTDELNILRDKIILVNNGAVTDTESEFRVNAPAATDSATLSTATRGRYVPGYAAEAGLGFRLGTRATGGSCKWGLYDDDDGLYFHLDDDGLSVQIERNNVVTLDIARADFNVDPLDGTGPSGIDVDDFGGLEGYLQQGHVFQVRFTWYGYGVIEWSVVDQSESDANGTRGEQRIWALHRERVRGNTSVEDPNLPVRVTAADGADVYVGGRQYSVLGATAVSERNIGTWRLSQTVPAASLGAGQHVPGDELDSDWVPLIAIRRRSDVEWAEAVAIVTDDFEIVSDEKLVVQIFIGATVDDGSWVEAPRTDGGSAVEVNVTGTALTFPSGTFPNQVAGLDPFIVPGSAGAVRESLTQTVTKRTDLPNSQEMILAALVPGAANATVDCVFDWLETR